MTDNIKKIVNTFELQEVAIKEAEQRLGFSFPKSLLSIYQKLGYGFVINQKGAINRFFDPMTCADIRLREDVYEFDPDLELYSSFEQDKMIFFEVNEGVYMSIGINDGKIYYLDDIIANDVVEFFNRISENPDYWCE